MMDTTPKGSRVHIALFGKRNAGKSSLINAITKQEVALVSPIAGTTTDPVYKAMEILPLGAVMFIDTAGLDDSGSLGEMRVKKSKAVLSKADVVLLVIDAKNGYDQLERMLLNDVQQRQLPVIAVFNKIDGCAETVWRENLRQFQAAYPNIPVVAVSALQKQNIDELLQKLISLEPQNKGQTIIGDLIAPEQIVLLVTPIDEAAPKGRLILPQVQVLRDILDHDAQAIVCQPQNLANTLTKLKNPPDLVITDSQAFGEVAAILPTDVPLTSFSILMARYKGDLALLTAGAKIIDTLKPHDKILIAEACTHHQQKDDIGTVKIPQLLAKRIGGPLDFAFVNGNQYPEDLSQYKLVIHCGGCMLNRQEMLYRLNSLANAQVPVVNYGVLLSALNNILDRAIAPLGLQQN